MHVFVFVFVCRGVQLISSTLNKRGLFSDCKSPTHSLLSPPLRTLSPALEARGDHNNNNGLLSLTLFLLPLFSLSLIHTHKHFIVFPNLTFHPPFKSVQAKVQLLTAEPVSDPPPCSATFNTKEGLSQKQCTCRVLSLVNGRYHFL